MTLLGIERTLTVELESGIGYPARQDCIVGGDIVGANDAAQSDLVLVAVLPNGLNAFDDEIAVGQDLDNRDGDLTQELIGIGGRTLGSERIGAARRGCRKEMEDAGTGI